MQTQQISIHLTAEELNALVRYMKRKKIKNCIGLIVSKQYDFFRVDFAIKQDEQSPATFEKFFLFGLGRVIGEEIAAINNKNISSQYN